MGEDTTLSQIIKMVSDAAATKAPIAKIADRVSGVFVPAVITIAVITTIILASGQDRALVMRWQEVFLFWLSAARVHLDLQRRLPLW